MPKYLLTISIGPVQSFIAAARRTRDLWYGSFLLSDVSRVIALCLQTELKGELIFPSVPPGTDLKTNTPAGAPRIANRITAVVESDDIAVLAKACRVVAQARLVALGNDCLNSIAKFQGVNIKRFNEQLTDVLEFYAAWVEYPETTTATVASPAAASSTEYKEKSDALDRLLSARKNTREFKPFIGEGGLTLSSLDGERESVLLPASSKGLRKQFRIDDAESLDSIGLIKRINGRALPFPSVIRVALEPWVATLSVDQLAQLNACFDKLVKEDCASNNATYLPSKSARAFVNFPYDGELVIRSRLDSRIHEFSSENADKDTLNALTALKALLYPEKTTPTFSAPPEDSLYVAILQADGDHMGKLLDCATTLKQHQEISATLATFAADAPVIIANHMGACVYAGGDDVLAMVPVCKAIACARALADAFKDKFTALVAELKVSPEDAPTLSVGIGIGHVLTPLSELRQLAAGAEKLAKQGTDQLGLRNALAVCVSPRGGSPVSVVDQWNEPAVMPAGKADAAKAPATVASGIDQRLNYWQAAFAEGALSFSTPYDLRELTREVSGDALAAEAARLIRRRSEGGSSAAVAQAIQTYLVDSKRSSAFTMLADELYVARWLNSHSDPSAAVVDAKSNVQELT